MISPRILWAAAVAAMLLAPAAALADATLTMNVAMPRTSSFFLGLYEPWKEAVEKESGGRIKIEMPAASLAPLARQWDMVASGVADVAMTPDDFIRQRVKLPFLAEIPFLAPNSVAASIAIWRTQQKFFNAAHEYKGMKLLGQWVNGGNTLMTVPRAVTKLADFRGLKLWVATPNMKDAVAAFGATPVPSEGSNSMFDYVSGGIVDGSVTGEGSLISFQIARYIKYMTIFPGQLGYNVFSFFMSQSAYDKLSPEDKAAIDRASYETVSREAAEGFVTQDRRGDDAVKQYGIAVAHASPEFMAELEPRIAFFKKDWLASAKERGIDGEAAYDYFAKTAREVAEQK
ncbi:MAG TPA: TRAP transporter substrate-binding protein DctP [Stellaceae bacterium]|nr:TRAP transporter substrate-binding protein DctP [Stellaceae bacterium]